MASITIFFRTLFSSIGVTIVVYIMIGVFFNTAAPHWPGSIGNAAGLHSWVQWVISVFFWPLSLWHPEFVLGKWTGH